MTDNDIPIKRPRLPIGTFHAIGCRGASSLERDGQPYYEYNRLWTGDDRPPAEVQFTDGLWWLADPTVDLVPGFYLDCDSEFVYIDRSYGPTWGGWATPVIEPEVLTELLVDLEEPHRWDGNAVWIDEDETFQALHRRPVRHRHAGLDVQSAGDRKHAEPPVTLNCGLVSELPITSPGNHHVTTFPATPLRVRACQGRWRDLGAGRGNMGVTRHLGARHGVRI